MAEVTAMHIIMLITAEMQAAREFILRIFQNSQQPCKKFCFSTEYLVLNNIYLKICSKTYLETVAIPKFPFLFSQYSQELLFLGSTGWLSSSSELPGGFA